MDKINFAESIYFNDSQIFDEKIYKLKTILFLDEDLCLAVIKPLISSDMDDSYVKTLRDEKILFNINNGQVLSVGHERFKLTQDWDMAISYTDHNY